MYSVDNKIVRRPSDVERCMLVCGCVAVDLSEIVFRDSLTLLIIRLYHKPFVDNRGRMEKRAN